MDVFYSNFYDLMQHRKPHIRRALLDEVDDTSRFICIRGTRGIGKTSFLLDYAAERFSVADRRCIYINLNHFCFSQVSIFSFAQRFVEEGGETLLIDQIYKYDDWEHELEQCYSELPNLRIVFTGSSVMSLSSPLLLSVVKVYDLRGFSFREYFSEKNHLHLPAITLEDILTHHTDIASEIISHAPIEGDFAQYLKTGYYPMIQEEVQFGEELVKAMNMTLEVDVIYIRQIDPNYLIKLRQLLFLVAGDMGAINISTLSKQIGVSRATVMNYIKYLRDAKMISLLYKKREEYPKKPAKIFLNNTNIAQLFYPATPTQMELSMIFLINQLSSHYRVNASPNKTADLLVDETHLIRLLDAHERSTRRDVYFAVSDILTGRENRIPLWLFGFLY